MLALIFIISFHVSNHHYLIFMSLLCYVMSCYVINNNSHRYSDDIIYNIKRDHVFVHQSGSGKKKTVTTVCGLLQDVFVREV